MDVGTNLKIETLIGKILAWNFYVIRTVVSGCNKIIRWLVLIFCPKIYFRDHTIVYINIFSYGIQPALYSLTWFSPDFTITSIVSLAFCRQFYGYRLFYEKTLMHTSQASCMVAFILKNKDTDKYIIFTHKINKAAHAPVGFKSKIFKLCNQ